MQERTYLLFRKRQMVSFNDIHDSESILLVVFPTFNVACRPVGDVSS